MKLWAGYLLVSFLVGLWSAVNADATGDTAVFIDFYCLMFDPGRETEVIFYNQLID